MGLMGSLGHKPLSQSYLPQPYGMLHRAHVNLLAFTVLMLHCLSHVSLTHYSNTSVTALKRYHIPLYSYGYF